MDADHREESRGYSDIIKLEDMTTNVGRTESQTEMKESYDFGVTSTIVATLEITLTTILSPPARWCT